MTTSAGMISLAVAYPSVIRTNEDWRRMYPERVKNAEKRAQEHLFYAETADPPTTAFEIEMEPYLSDPFRGTMQRRWFGPGESGQTIGRKAGREAIELAGLKPTDIDLVISTALYPDKLISGDATFYSEDLGCTNAASFNIESLCSGATISLYTAASLVETGRYQNVLIVATCTYSRDIEHHNTLAWFTGDGAGSFVVSALPKGFGVLGARGISSRETISTFETQVLKDKETNVHRPILFQTAGAGKILKETAEPYLRFCCEEAAKNAGVTFDDIDFWIVHTPTAWFSAFAARALGFPKEKTVNTFPYYSNCGPAIPTSNLHFAIRSRKIKTGDLVMLFSVGSVSSANAVVMRWCDVPLGSDPAEVDFDN